MESNSNDPGDHSDTLCVLVRGWTNSDDWICKLTGNDGGDFPAAFVSFVEKQLSGADFIYPEELDLDMGLFSAEQPRDLSKQILETVRKNFDRQKHKRITFVAYSSGAPITRYALMRAFGATESGAIDVNEVEDWADGSVQVRAVYLAGILRGWRYSTAMPTHIRLLSVPLGAVAHSVCLVRKKQSSFIFELKHDSEFILQSRLMQFALRNTNERDTLPFEQVSILGSKDEFISPADCIEVSGSGSTVFVEVSSTNHLEMLAVSQEDSAEREDKISIALTNSIAQMRAMPGYAIPHDDVDDYFDDLDRPRIEVVSKLNRDVENAVIVLHGIRDNGFWTKRVARQLKEHSARPLLRAPSPSYGFFSILDFIRLRTRKKQARWLVEQFIDIRDCYPNAKISFVGHSNGTYLAKAAIKEFPAIQFDRLVLAGSVIRTDFDWDKVADSVSGGVLNLMGTRDFVVACLPGALQSLGLRTLDVGGAGFHGFETDKTDESLVVNRQVEGGHGAGISEASWNTIQDFIVEGKIPDQEAINKTRFEVFIGKYGHWILPAVLAILLVLFGYAFSVLVESRNPSLLFFMIFLLWLVNKLLREA